MTKDGRPSRISDIRYFCGDLLSYLKGHEEAVAFGRRLAWYLNGEGFSLGAYPALYLFFTPSVPSGSVHVTDFGGEWWHRYTHVGVERDFPNRTDAIDIVIEGTVLALSSIRPDQAHLIRTGAQVVQQHGAGLRFPIKRKETKALVLEVSSNIAPWPEQSSLFVSITDKSTGAYFDAPPISMQIYFDVFDLAGNLRVSESAITIEPNSSIGARLTSERHGGPLVFDRAAFAKSARPVTSKIINRRA